MRARGCWTPGKLRFSSAEAAEVFRDKHEAKYGVDLLMRPYPCRKHWHLGHRDGGFNSWSLRRALAAGKTPRTSRLVVSGVGDERPVRGRPH